MWGWLYHFFGGTERDLQFGEEWKEKWSAVQYLEGLSEVLNIMEKSSQKDAPHNINWMKKSLRKIVGFKGEDKSFDQTLEKDKVEAIKSFSWECIQFSADEAPHSAFERNKLWVSVINKQLKTSENSILITVGDGHLVGFKNGFSLLKLLIDEIKIEHFDRYTNGGKWEPVEIQ